MTKKEKAPAPRATVSLIKDDSGASLATLSSDDKAVAVKIARKNNPEFSQWFEERAEAALKQIFDQWVNESGSGS